MIEPLFSIIIPTHNRAHLIESTISSCLNQEFNHKFEILIIDDGSTDNTSERVEAMQSSQIRYFSIKNSERGAARNFGTNKSRGQFITFLDSDDLLHPNHLTNAYQLIEKYNLPEIIHLGYQIIDDRNKVLQKFDSVPYKNLTKAILEGNYMSCMGVFLRKDIAIKNPFSEIRELSGTEDWLLWLQLAARYQIYFSEVISASMIDHDGRSTKNYTAEELDNRTYYLIHSLKADKMFISVFGENIIKRIQSHMLTYSGLHLMLSNKKTEGWKRFLDGVKLNPREIFTRRTLAVLKYSLK